MLASLRATPTLLLQPFALLRRYPASALRTDLIAGATVGMVLLPQALAFSLLAGLPPAMGLYTAIVAAAAGALWGSSAHLNTGPTNTASILTLTVLLPIAAPGTPQFIAAAGVVAVFAGLIRLALGLARLGLLVNFISDSVAVGFTAGAGILIMSNQLGPLLRVDLAPSSDLITTLRDILVQAPAIHLLSLALGLATIGLLLLLQRLAPKLPGVLVSIALVSAVAWLIGAEGQGARVLGDLPRSLPPLAQLPFDLALIGQLANGALALALIGLVEAVAIARSIAGHSHQRLDSNREFVGQGIANILAGIFSGYPCSGSFNRSMLNFRTGGQTALSNLFSAGFVLTAMFVFGPLLAHLPRPVLAGTLLLTAFSMIDRPAIQRIWRGTLGETAIMLVTLGATLLLPLQVAVLTGVLMSLAYYLLKTSKPQVYSVLPDDSFRHWIPQQKQGCPQLGVVEVLGDLYFGACNHVEERVDELLQQAPRQRSLLLRMHSVQRCDISGVRALENILRSCRARGGNLYLVGVRPEVLRLLRSTNFDQQLGPGGLLGPDTALDYLFHKVLDPATCIYECDVRAFRECQNLPKRTLTDIPVLTERRMPALSEARTIAPQALWQMLYAPQPPLVIDVREPREYKQGHIPQAQLIPLPKIMAGQVGLAPDQPIVLVCRSGRRSLHAAALLAKQGYRDLIIVEGGMLAWETANLLEAVE